MTPGKSIRVGVGFLNKSDACKQRVLIKTLAGHILKFYYKKDGIAKINLILNSQYQSCQVDAFKIADNHVQIVGADRKLYSLSDACSDVSALVKLSDEQVSSRPLIILLVVLS